jgi:hypothetical protein
MNGDEFMDSKMSLALKLAAYALLSFRAQFGVELSFSRLCEIYVAFQLGFRSDVQAVPS